MKKRTTRPKSERMLGSHLTPEIKQQLRREIGRLALSKNPAIRRFALRMVKEYPELREGLDAL
jgi:hypothetical protein